MVIQAGWADLRAAHQEDDEVVVIGEAPHDWLFPQMAAERAQGVLNLKR